MSDLVTIIMPMAGRGSRFAAQGERRPKPLIEICGAPMFYWATQSLIREVPDAQLVYVVLREHVAAFSIDTRVTALFPQARVAVIPEVTSGALETALKGLELTHSQSKVIINDCDHAFSYSALRQACSSLSAGASGFLSHFSSTVPHFSYASYDAVGRLVETAEKQVISSRAIAGIYGFRDPKTLSTAAETYTRTCPYPELFVSGIYNQMVREGGEIRGFDLDFHVPFGTPEEYREALSHMCKLESLKR